MSAEEFIAELERRRMLPERVIKKLRAKIAESERPFSARGLAKFLVEKRQLSQKQADDVLNALLANDTDIDDATRAKSPVAPSRDEKRPANLPADDETEASEILDPEVDAESGSSIFAPFLARKPSKRTVTTKPQSDREDELTLLPDDEPTEIRQQNLRTRPAAQPANEQPTGEKKSRPEPKRRRTPKPEKTSTDVAELDQDALVAADESTKQPKRVGLRSKKKKRWDSPLMLLGGGGLALMLLSGATIWWLLNRETGDQQLALARAALKSGAYSQAIEHYERFLEGSPRHPGRSSARVQLAMVQLRQAVESGNYSAALELAEAELKEIEDEEDFDEAHPELAALLPQIALGFAKQAEKAAPGAEEVNDLNEKAQKTLELCNNVTYIPKTMRDEGKLAQVRESLQLTAHRQQSHHALQEALASMEKSTSEGNTAASYVAHRKLVRDYSQLAADAGLQEMLKQTIVAEQAAIKFVKEEQAAETSERPTPWIAALAVAHHRGAPAAARASGTACVRVNGALYGLDVATGRLLWRRQVGYAAAAPPLRTGNDALVTDGARHELLRLEATTGRLLWRQAIGEPFAQPLVVDDRAYVAGETGRLHVVDLKSGARAGYVQFAQSLRVPPAVDRQKERLYLAGGHSNLYTLALADLSCLGIYYLGHADGSISVSPVHVLDKLAVVENDGVETSRLHLMSLDDKGAVGKQETESRLTGLPAAAPLVAGRRMLMVTDRGQIQVYDVASAEGDKALSRVATREASGTQPLGRHVALVERTVWIGDTQLTKYSILPTGNRLPVESIQENFAGATFDHPLELFGESLVHVHRPNGRSSAIVAATATADGRVLWETELAMPPAGPPIVDDSTKTLAVCTAEGHIFHFEEAAIRSRVQDQPLAAQSPPVELPALTSAVDLGQGRAAFCAPDSDQLLLYNPSLRDRAAQWIKLESPLACAVTRLGDGLIAPLKVGQVFYLRTADGTQMAAPFQPRLEPGTNVDYRTAAVVDSAANRFVIADGGEKIYLVEAVAQPQRHLRAFAEAKAGPFPIESRIVVLGDVGLAVAGSSHVLRFSLPSLESAGELALTAPVVWGPYPVANGVLLATADDHLVFISPGGETAWRVPIEHGDLAGEPLAVQDGVLLAYRKGIIERRSTADGTALAAKDLEHPLASGPVRFQQRLVLSAHDGTLLVVDGP
jgi:tetratricopeptide (TPR) repeat protein